jgi:hypothetical protein
MKQKLLFIIFFAISLTSVRAQGITVTPSDSVRLDSTIGCQSEAILIQEIHNTSNDTIQMNWHVVGNTMPHSWSLGYCYLGYCLTSNYIGPTFHFNLGPANSGPMQLDVTTGTAGSTDSGSFQVHIWVTGDSVATAQTLTYSVNLVTSCTAAGINEATAPLQLSLYPNPVRSDLTVTLPESLNNGQINIFNLLGSKVYSQSVNSREISKDLDLSALESGVYIVRITDGSTIIATRKFTKVD